MQELLPARQSFSRQAEGFRANAFGGLIYEDNSLHVIGIHPCHGFLQTSYWGGYARRSPIKYILSAIRAEEITDEALAEDFYDWLFNRSPWANVFVEKSYQQARLLGVVARVDLPANLIATAMIASRFMTETYASEQRYRRAIYKELRNIGYDEATSFVFAHLFNSVNVSKGLYPVHFSRFSSGHSVFYATGISEGYFRNFFNNTPPNLSEVSLLANKGYKTGTLNSLWGNSSDRDAFATWCGTVAPPKKSKGQDHHIFRAKPKDTVVLKNAEDFKAVVDLIKERIFA